MVVIPIGNFVIFFCNQNIIDFFDKYQEREQE